MVKGRRPDANAIRRGGVKPDVQPVEASIVGRIQKPDHIAANPTMSRCWDVLVAGSPAFQPMDAPLLEAYCLWYAILRQAESQTVTPDGRVITLYGEKGADGKVLPTTVKANPDIRTAQQATNMLRQLAVELQTTPAARDRAGLVQAMTRSTQADVVKKTMEGYAEFRRRRDAED